MPRGGSLEGNAHPAFGRARTPCKGAANGPTPCPYRTAPRDLPCRAMRPWCKSFGVPINRWVPRCFSAGLQWRWPVPRLHWCNLPMAHVRVRHGHTKGRAVKRWSVQAAWYIDELQAAGSRSGSPASTLLVTPMPGSARFADLPKLKYCPPCAILCVVHLALGDVHLPAAILHRYRPPTPLLV